MKLTLRHYGLLALITFTLTLFGRMTLPPLDRDEPRYMEASEQMLLSGNFIDVRFQDKPRYLQPAGIYWLEAGGAALARAVIGPSVLQQAWPYRLPSLIAASLSIPLTAWIGSVLFSEATGLLAAGFLLVSTLFAAESRMATIDTVLLLDILLVEAALVQAFLNQQNGSPTPRKTALLYWLACGIGLMLKGPVVLIPAFGTPCAFWLSGRIASHASPSSEIQETPGTQGLLRRLRPRWGWLIMVAVALPWCIAIYILSHGTFFSRAIGHNFVGKIGHGQESHGLLPGYHLAVFTLAFWPGSLFTAMALPAIWKQRFAPQVRFLLSWIMPHWLIFELIATKLPHYVLPTYPAIAILTAASLTLWPTVPIRPWAKVLLSAYGAVCFLVSVGFCVAGTLLLAYLEHMISAPAVIACVGAAPLLILSVICVLRAEPLQAALCALGVATIVHSGLFLAVIPNLRTVQLAPRVAALFHAVKPCPDSVLVSTSYSEPSLVFLSGPQTQLLAAATAADYIETHRQCSLALVDRKDEASFRHALTMRGINLIEYGRVSGLNYSNGHSLDLGLFAPR